MSKITGTIYIEFETEEDITEEQFALFKKVLNREVINSSSLDDIAEGCGFEIQDFNPISLEDIDCEY